MFLISLGFRNSFVHPSKVGSSVNRKDKYNVSDFLKFMFDWKSIPRKKKERKSFLIVIKNKRMLISNFVAF